MASLWGMVTLHPLMSSQSVSLKKAGSSPLGTMNGTITLLSPSCLNAALWTTGLKLCSIGSPRTPYSSVSAIDRVVGVIFLHHAVGDHPRREDPFGIETRVGERCPEFPAEDPGEHADLTHGDRDHRPLGRRAQVQDTRRLRQRRRRRCNLDHVRIELLALVDDVLQVDRSCFEVMVADDPLGLAETANLAGDVHFQVDVVDAQRDGFPNELLPFFFVAAPKTAVDAAPDREHRRRRAILQDPLQVGIAAQAVDAQLDQLDSGLSGFLPLLGER